ncbi:hypothetical protein JQU17_13535 [Ponticoccus sp. SC2-23]|nr:hypothetical protein [Ponticoccus sp. SC6-9]MBM1225821.1 hypothetical protein [Ponticoccus sp. SC6-15]MBM1227973.1 hypothetical protein [Ponticoccus sp. SC6-38]MBM1234389.1 hypothetical protein [Ponticoccus sp. SC6-45]MBM1238475.1 hypothetical protein [Ponticoccus sp. SC6-49]MBM1243744.1 hypothetical protein [Ponticoccus sp. SC2-64]MBM1247913.1 hypothetical protein [Ponticoccus sp. SC6-42]MBM1252875.1 hypothetical protein [Ponticoccus sp. SC6-33]MBM1256484.1 hypothetical protein [Pontico
MKPLVTPFLNRLRRLARREEGSMSIEAMIIIPVLIWSMLGSWVFFDAFRAQFSNAKASYTLGDIISRESGYITDEYIDSLYTLQRFLAARPEDIRLRVSVIKYDEDDDTHYVVWSENRGGGGTIDDDDIENMRDSIPIMADAGRAIIVQTSVEFEPVLSGLIEPVTFDDFVVTRPRFSAQVCFNTNNSNPTAATAIC